jgi:hypothetical protein
MAHSAIVGGSTAARLLNCNGSYQAQLSLPVSVDVPSQYAEEGTFAHKVMDRIMLLRQHAGRPFNPFLEVRTLVGLDFHDRALTQAHLDELIEPALVHLAVLEKGYGGGFEVLAVEKSVDFPGVPGAHGTVDLILGNADTILLVDWKFGGGVPVGAVYKDEQGELINPQLMFYATAAKHSARHFFKGRTVCAIAIVQPRTDPGLTHTTISNRDMKWFGEDLRTAVTKAIGRDPERQKGEWCRWAPCKVSCPLWTGPLLDLASLQLVPRTEMVAKEVTPYAEYLARAKALVDQLALFSKEVNDQLHAYLEDGGTVPGWKLKLKAKQRQWINEEIVNKELEQLGFDWDEIWDTKLATFGKVDAAARRHGVKIPEHLRVAPPTNETTVTTSDDPAPAVERHTAIEQFAASLADLRKQA